MFASLSPRPFRILASIFAACVVTLAVAGVAQGAESYIVRNWPACSTYEAGGNYDATGNLYAACGKAVWVKPFGKAGTVVPLSRLVSDVAPSPNGKVLYAISGGKPVRFSRNLDGTYQFNSAWNVDPFTLGGKSWVPNGVGITTDFWGNIFVSNSHVVDGQAQPNVILRYTPAGRLRNVIGDGTFAQNMGIGVTRDGRTLYLVEKEPGSVLFPGDSVERWDINANGLGFHRTTTWGRLDNVNCSTGNFAAPGDVGVDAWGFVYVMDTSCERVQKFDANGTFLYQASTGSRTHKFAVGIDGNVFVGAGSNVRLLRTTAVPGPWPTPQPLPVATPDAQAPVLAPFTLPATTTSQTITITLSATDNVAVTEMRFANEDGIWSAWMPFTATHQHLLSAGYTYKGVFAQVRDAALNESAVQYATTLFLAPV